MMKAILSLLLCLFPLSSGQYNFFEYEVIPLNQDGGNGVGDYQGGGETKFEYHEFGKSVQTIEAWQSGRDIRCIKVKWFDLEKEPVTIGTQPDGNPTVSFTFERGDPLTGDIVLSSNSATGAGAAAKIGYIFFKTKGGKTFEVGDSGGPDYRFPSGESYLMGFQGWSGANVHILGLYMMKPYPKYKLIVEEV